jgi:DNA (cytosine-5)-methyltransferase 1
MGALGYAVSPMVLDAADHGVPQNRRRLFIICTKSEHPIELAMPEREHVPVSNVIDFTAGQWSRIRRAGRSTNQLARVEAGRKVHGERFLTAYYGNEYGGRALSRPIGTLTTNDRYGVIDGDRMRMLSVREARDCMGFPVDYQLPASHKDAMKMLGNAVVPQVACDVIEALQEAA